MKTGLVLEGGAMRGMYTAGVLDVFMKHGIEFDSIAAVSAGALFGVNFLSKQEGRVIRYNKRFNADKNYLGLIPLLKEGNIINTKYAYYDVPRNLDVFDDDTYKKAETPFYAVVTNIQNGKPEYMQVKSVYEQMETLRASGSMPFLSKPVSIGNQKYLDGGISDSIPFEWLLEQGCDKIVVILTRDRSYRKKAMSKLLISLFYNQYPQLCEKLINRHSEYNESLYRLSRLEEEKKAFIIRPSEPIKIGRIEKNPDKLQIVYEMGINDAEMQMKALIKYTQG